MSVNDLWCWLLRNPFRVLEFFACHRDSDSDLLSEDEVDSE